MYTYRFILYNIIYNILGSYRNDNALGVVTLSQVAPCCFPGDNGIMHYNIMVITNYYG